MPLFIFKEKDMNLEALKPLLTSKIKELGYKTYSISTKKEKGDLILEIIIDRKEPIDMNDIVDVSNTLSSYLDEIDNSEESYNLDVSSLGAEKPLEIDELKDYDGSYIHIHLINPIEGNNIFEGTIDKVDDHSLTLSYKIKTRTKQVIILLDNIYKVRLAIKF